MTNSKTPTPTPIPAMAHVLSPCPGVEDGWAVVLVCDPGCKDEGVSNIVPVIDICTDEVQNSNDRN